MCFSNFIFASSEDKKEKIEIGPVIMHHILDDYQYEITEGLVIPLPIIIFSKTDGLKIFSSSNLFDESHNPKKDGYMGYMYDHGHLKTLDSNNSFIDLSITKNVLFLFINAFLMLLIFLLAARGYKSKNHAPRGIQSIVEPLIIFIRDC